MPTATPSDADARWLASPSAGAGQAATATPVGRGRGFAPGVVLASRFRIIGLLGRGGMGEVYRADDLKLGQPVALKFLPPALARDAALLERFHAEARNARQVSHPNVCRVYDIGEVDGQHFLTMEHVDGEDLAALLKRIGRLPATKALEIARQLCAGLAAAHEKGVLHRDLKPSNVMLDGHGRTRITDFGLALRADEVIKWDTSGTPTYMAPEQLDGRGASIRSDLYSLGLVLYELFTGKRAFEATSLAELRRKHAEALPKAPSTHAADIDPGVERAILRCLEKDPHKRPASALQLAAALPGGDPLAAVLAAGETPSPEMVAAAGEEGVLGRRKAWLLLGGVLAITALVVALSPYSTDWGRTPVEKSGDELMERAHEIAQRFGYTKRTDWAYGFGSSGGYKGYRVAHPLSREQAQRLGVDAVNFPRFWYRQSPRPMIPLRNISVTQPEAVIPDEFSGALSLFLDGRGRLMEFRAVPPQFEDAKGPPTAPDWAALFAEAGLDQKNFMPVDPKWVPDTAFDARAAWEGPYADFTLHLAAAAYRGRLVFFKLIGPWERASRMQTETAGTIRTAAFIIVMLMTVAGASFFARRNLRLGRGDRRGALRISLYVLACYGLGSVLVLHHVSDLKGEFQLFFNGMGFALFWSAFLWLMYMAIEPYVRRHWPNLLIGWNRVLVGRFRDPLVGRDIVVGALFGAAMVLVDHLTVALPRWLPLPYQGSIGVGMLGMGAPSWVVGFLLCLLQISSLMWALGIITLLFLMRVLLRKQWLAVGVSWIVLALIFISWGTPIRVALALLWSALLYFVLLRFGILALAVAWLFANLDLAPVTPDFSQWYAWRAVLILLPFAALLLYGFRTALGRQPIFGGAALDE